MEKEKLVSNGYDVYAKVEGDIIYLDNLTKEQALELVNATEFNYKKVDLHDMRFKLVHQTETHVIFKQ